MRRWIPRFGRSTPGGSRGSASGSGDGPNTHHTLELLVVEGADTGSRFTIDGEEVTIGRSGGEKGLTGEIGLHDPAVSSEQASIRVGEVAVELEHRSGAGTPTLVNGHSVGHTLIQVGDRIQMGATVFEVRSRPGISLSGLMAIPKLRSEESTFEGPVLAEPSSDTSTEVREALPPTASLVVIRGIRALEGQRLPLLASRNRVGRHPENDVVLTEQGVSRFHAEVVWDERRWHLLHKSATNPSYVDGRRVEERTTLRDGQIIQLADRVALRIDLPEDAPQDAEVPEPSEGAGVGGDREPSLKDRMEEKILRDEEIEREYGFFGSFLDIDVVDSHGLKVRASRPEHVIVSFERFRGFARQVVEDHAGQVLNSNGDELMCFFDAPLDAVRAATAVLDRLGTFNNDENLLPLPFRVRLGIHTGRSLVDRERGVAYSPVLDVAGHLQKHAPVDGLLISDETLVELPAREGFESVGPLGKEEVVAHRLLGNEPSAD